MDASLLNRAPFGRRIMAFVSADARQNLISRCDGRVDMAGTGKRAFDNVRKAVGTVRKHLRQGGREERAFEEHLRSQLSIGHECLYTAPEVRVWV